ncbi:MAG: hypothetical protein JWN14_330 [Chthonomonadales bacterium]|nr:hypothetical protein [Chthonomonadales bacterium]
MNKTFDVEHEKIQWRWLEGFTQITELRQVIQSGIEPARDHFKRLHYEGFSSVVRQIRGDSVKDETIEEIAEGFAESTMITANLTTDAAALIFGHTLLDAAALDYLKVTLRVSPKEWEHHYKTKLVKIKIADIRADQLEQRISEQVKVAFKEWDNASLPNKVKQLRIFCDTTLPYNLERLERLDKERHGIIHGNDLRLKEREQDFYDDLNFMMHTAEYCSVLVGRKFGFHIQDFVISRNEMEEAIKEAQEEK